MDNYSLPIVAIIGGAQNQLTKEDTGIVIELGKIVARLGIRAMTKWRDEIYDALVLGANTLGKAPFITSLDNNDRLAYQEDVKMGLDRTYALHLTSASIIILPGGLENLVDAFYLILQDANAVQKKPLYFWGEEWETIIQKIADQNYFNENQKSQIIILKNLEDMENRLSQLV